MKYDIIMIQNKIGWVKRSKLMALRMSRRLFNQIKHHMTINSIITVPDIPTDFIILRENITEKKKWRTVFSQTNASLCPHDFFEWKFHQTRHRYDHHREHHILLLLQLNRFIEKQKHWNKRNQVKENRGQLRRPS